MKKIFLALVALAASTSIFATTLAPVQLLNPIGSTSGQAIVSTGASTAPGWSSIVDSVIAGSGIALSGTTGNVTVSIPTNGVALTQIAQQAANTLLGNATGATANVTAVTVTGCNGAAQALQWTNGTGFGCNSNIATSGANSNITSLSGLTTALSVAQGGTGLATITAHNVLIGNGTTAVTKIAPSTAGQALISNGATNDPSFGLPTGTLINVQVFTSSGTYTPTSGTASIVVELLGGGGAGGGAATTSTGQISVGGGGSAGAYSIGRITSAFSGVTVTIGAAGVGASGAAGGNGGNSSFGALMTANGGQGGAIGAGATTTPTISLASGTAATASGGSIANVNGSFGEYGESIAAGLNIGGKGASSQLGSGGGAGVNGTAPTAASGFGAGGGGAANPASTAAQAGTNGTKGIAIIYEYD